MPAHVLSHLPTLQATVPCEILSNPQSTKFQEHLARWTDIDLKTPAAIILPTSEEECVKIVQWALHYNIPFVTKSGGHSAWSTIDESGIVIDLSAYKGVEVDTESQTATLIGGILSKEVGIALAEKGLFTALGNGNTVGSIPYFLGGGSSLTNSITGFGADNIISAKLITAAGDLVVVNEEEHPDLLYALRGAGQFFGLVTQLTIQAYPTTLLRHQQGLIWVGSFIFDLEQAFPVATAMQKIMDDPTHPTAGLMMVMAPPPSRSPCLVISARYTGSEDPSVPFAALYALQPTLVTGGDVPIQNASDARAALGVKGGFKAFGVVGLHSFNVDAFVQTVEVWKEMVETCPDALNSAFNFQWDSRPPRGFEREGACSLGGVRYWQNNLIWHTDSANREKIDTYNERCINIVREADTGELVDFVNGTRTGPIERRFRGVERLETLRRVKREWDARGVFTRELLDD
ncbi:hypothetical protein BDW74DRAFT_176333 [Aspergillus multicolor]|uniref:FAD-binding oxidoreductase n=1 Tax=Aspergillus multicolor TaxID=41759 RepID=UPI003CCCD194